MNAVAQPETDYEFATTCLAQILERTSKLLIVATGGGNWSELRLQRDIAALPLCAAEFLVAVGLEKPDYAAAGSGTPHRAIRILGDLHGVVTALLVERAVHQVRPDLGESFATKHQMMQVYEIALEFAHAAKVAR